MRWIGALLNGWLLLAWTGCGHKENGRQYDGERLLERHCAACHNLDMPPKTTENEKAPPMMAVVFHIRDFMNVRNPSEKKERFVDFVVDYALHPSASKSFCDKKSLQEYGVMPSLEGKITPDELMAVANYIYDHYDPEAFMSLMTEQARLAALPPYKRVLEQKNCLGCHGIEKDKIAPSFKRISEKFRRNGGESALMQAIHRGSRGAWPGFKLAMPPFKDLDDASLRAIAEWMLKQ
ncbi:c-type cytochrome [Hydrogenimonas sp.]